MKGDAAKLARHFVERALEVLIPEELGVRQPRADHLLVAGDDLLAAILGDQVRHAHEAVGELAGLRVLQREALLVVLHRGRQAFGRNGQEFLVERAHQHGRPFGETGVLRQQALVLDEFEFCAGGDLPRLFRDPGRALGGGQQRLVGLELLSVVLEARHLEPRVAVEAMSLRGVAGADAIDLDRHDLAVDHADDRVQRANPGQCARAPALRLRPGELADHVRHDLGDDLARRAARLLDARDVVVALLLILDHGGVVERGEARALQKALDRLLGRAYSGALALLRYARRHRGQAIDHQCEASRRRERLRGRAIEPQRLQPVDHEAFQVFRRTRLHAGRNFLGEQLEQELGHG